MMKIHLKIKYANYSILQPNIVIEIMLTQHLINFKTFLNDSYIKSPALFSEMAMLIPDYSLRRRDSALR